MILAGLDLNSSRARAVIGGPELQTTAAHFDDDAETLPVALGLHGRQPEAGRPGIDLCRAYPHLACLDFLVFVGTPRRWQAGRHNLDAADALTAFLARLRQSLSDTRALVWTLPSYLSAAQATQAIQIARTAKLPLAGSINSALACGVAAYQRQAWSGPALLLDVDHYALTWAVVDAKKETLNVTARKALPHLSTRAWKMHLLHAIADQCILHSRRDPRDSGAAEQMLYDQLDLVFDACRQERLAEIVVRTGTWCQNLMLTPQQTLMYCDALIGVAAEELASALPSASGDIKSVILTEAVEQLPGMAVALSETAWDRFPVVHLPDDAAARSAFALATAPARVRQVHHVHQALPLPPREDAIESTSAPRPVSRRRADAESTPQG